MDPRNNAIDLNVDDFYEEKTIQKLGELFLTTLESKVRYNQFSRILVSAEISRILALSAWWILLVSRR